MYDRIDLYLFLMMTVHIYMALLVMTGVIYTITSVFIILTEISNLNTDNFSHI